MPKGLAVIADQIHLLFGDPGFPADGLSRLAVQLPQQEVDAAEVRRAGAFAAGQPKDLGPNLRRKRHEGEGQLLYLCGQARTGNTAKRRVHAVRAGARHEAQHDAGRFLKQSKNGMFHRKILLWDEAE